MSNYNSDLLDSAIKKKDLNALKSLLNGKQFEEYYSKNLDKIGSDFEKVLNTNDDFIKTFIEKLGQHKNIFKDASMPKTFYQYAIDKESKLAIGELVKAGFDINPEIEKTNPLRYATLKGSIKSMDALKHAGANIDIRYGSTPFIDSITNKKANPAIWYFRNDANIDLAAKDGTTPLIAAVKSDNRKMFDHLLNMVANINKVDKMDKSSLMYACESGREYFLDKILDLHKHLIEKQIDPKRASSKSNMVVKRREYHMSSNLDYNKAIQVAYDNKIDRDRLYRLVTTSKFTQDYYPLFPSIERTKDKYNKELKDISQIAPAQKDAFINKKIKEINSKEYKESISLNPIKGIKDNWKHTLVDPTPVTKSEYPTDILKKYMYLQDRNRDVVKISAVLDNLRNNKSLYLQAVITCAALNSIKKGGLRTFGAKSTQSINSLELPHGEETNSNLGKYVVSENNLYFSNLDKNNKSARILLHELTHSVVFSIFKEKMEHAQKNENKKDGMTELTNMASDVKNRIEVFEKSMNDLKLMEQKLKKGEIKDENSKKAIQYALDNTYNRLLGNTDAYAYKKYQSEEFLCDVTAMEQYKTRHSDRSKQIENCYKPMVDYANGNVLPEMIKYILNHPNLKLVKLPLEVKNGIMKLYPNEVEKIGIKIVKPFNLNKKGKSDIGKSI